MKNILITLSILVVLLTACNAPFNTQPAIDSHITENLSNIDATPSTKIEVETSSLIDEDDGSIDPTTLSTAIASIETTTLTEAEILSLHYMREEEKLARDVYLALHDIWGLQIFTNIANSEQTHTDAVKTLIDRYGITDYFSAEYGVFINPDLQALYDQLVEQGSQSIGDAIKVGAAIEEIDILDLEESLAKTDKADIFAVYNNLLKGSENHLRAFVSTLQRQTGEVYEPQYMSSEAYDNVITASGQTGNVGKGGRRN